MGVIILTYLAGRREGFLVNVSNTLLTWKELCKYYYNFYYYISLFDSHGITGYTMVFLLFYITLVILLKPFEEKIKTDLICFLQNLEYSFC